MVSCLYVQLMHAFWNKLGVKMAGYGPSSFLYVSGKLPTYPSPKPTLTLTSHLGQNVGLGEG